VVRILTLGFLTAENKTFPTQPRMEGCRSLCSCIFSASWAAPLGLGAGRGGAAIFVRGRASAAGSPQLVRWRWSCGRMLCLGSGCCCCSCPRCRAARRSQVGAGAHVLAGVPRRPSPLRSRAAGDAGAAVVQSPAEGLGLLQAPSEVVGVLSAQDPGERPASAVPSPGLWGRGKPLSYPRGAACALPEEMRGL
jgi:hypothetical protein